MTSRSWPVGFVLLFLVAPASCNGLLGIEDKPPRPDAGAVGSGEAGPGPLPGADAGSRYRQAVFADGPVLYLPLDEAVGPTLRDVTGAERGSYPNTGITYGVAGALASDGDTAIAVDGTSRIHITSAPDVRDLHAFSVEVWAKHGPDAPDYGFVVDGERYEGTQQRFGWDLVVGPAGIYFERWNKTDHASLEATALSPNEWHHVVATFDGHRLRVFVDGKDAAKAANVTSDLLVTPGITDWAVGGQDCECSGNSFAGSLDELAIYDRPLTDLQIQAHLTAGR